MSKFFSRTPVALLFAAILFAKTASAATNIWTGATSTNWATVTDWSLGAVPVAGDDVVIPNVANKPVAFAPPPTLGTYPNTSVVSGKNTTVTPSAAPTGATSITAIATGTSGAAFTGTFAVDPTTGVVTVTDAKQAGIYTVAVTAFDGGGMTTTQTFQLTVTDPVCSQGRFGAATGFGVGSNPQFVAVGDFNGDGNQDLAVAKGFVNGNLSILLGNGSGGFGAATNFGIDNGQANIAVGDFNGDGKQDLAVPKISSNNVSILLGNGAGGFGAPTDFGVAGSNSLRQVAVGDFNGDGKQDLAVTNFSSNNVSILLGNGAGGFGAPTNFGVGSNRPRPIAVGDFNGDGKQDLAVANSNTGSDNVSILLGNGAGGFGAPTNFAVGPDPISIAVGDFNGDGKQDLATVQANSNKVSILLGNGAGGFGAETTFTVGSSPWFVAVGDFNGDGKQDLATANINSSNTSILLGNGTGGFGAATNFGAGSSPHSLAVGDFNGDGKEDLAVSNFNTTTVSILLGGVDEINVSGNGMSIVDGDASPSTADHTDFGPVCFLGNMARTFTIENTAATALTVSGIAPAGGDAALFAVSGISFPATVAGGASTTFMVTFHPTSFGLKTTTLHITNDDCDEADYDFAIAGTGDVPSAPAPSAACMQAFCIGDSPTVGSLAPNGAGYMWYSSANSTTPLPAGTALVNGGVYFVSQIVAGCETMRARVNVVVTTPAPGKVCIGGCSN